MLAEQLKLIMAEEGNSEDFWHAGLPCSVWRSPHSGAWAGYVGVNTTSPLYGVNMTLDYNIDVHGGISYSGCRSFENDFWWFGFDCWHLHDIQPERVFSGDYSELDDEYKTYCSKNYAMRETKRLAEQLAAIQAELSE